MWCSNRISLIRPGLKPQVGWIQHVCPNKLKFGRLIFSAKRVCSFSRCRFRTAILCWRNWLWASSPVHSCSRSWFFSKASICLSSFNPFCRWDSASCFSVQHSAAAAIAMLATSSTGRWPAAALFPAAFLLASSTFQRRCAVNGMVFASVPAGPGSSGGPLINRRGEVIGITTWQFQSTPLLTAAVSTSTLQADWWVQFNVSACFFPFEMGWWFQIYNIYNFHTLSIILFEGLAP